MLNFKIVGGNRFVSDEKINNFCQKIKKIHQRLHSISHKSNDFKGWLNWPITYSKNEIKKIKLVAEKIKNDSEIFIVIGVGGSYLGARAAIEFLNSENYNYIPKSTPNIFFVGNSLASREILEILKLCENKDVSVCVISKSGTTTEPAIAFRIFKNFMENKYGPKSARERIYCITDSSVGALRTMVQEEGYVSFEIPANIGGRYSVLTAVGLLPIAVSGADIDKILEGSESAYKRFLSYDLAVNECYRYAVIRNIFYENNRKVEIMTGYEPSFRMFFEWWKQLFGESEGKDGKGIFPASSIFTTDLHSIGQFIQEGNKLLFETVLMVSSDNYNLEIEYDDKNYDELNYLSGKTLEFVNKKAMEATINAHVEGDVPNIILEIDNNNEYNLGYLIYFFEKACAVSSYLQGVNPFNQPGVELYKNNMFRLLGKPGYY